MNLAVPPSISDEGSETGAPDSCFQYYTIHCQGFIYHEPVAEGCDFELSEVWALWVYTGVVQSETPRCLDCRRRSFCLLIPSRRPLARYPQLLRRPSTCGHHASASEMNHAPCHHPLLLALKYFKRWNSSRRMRVESFVTRPRGRDCDTNPEPYTK